MRCCLDVRTAIEASWFVDAALELFSEIGTSKRLLPGELREDQVCIDLSQPVCSDSRVLQAAYPGASSAMRRFWLTADRINSIEDSCVFEKVVELHGLHFGRV